MKEVRRNEIGNRMPYLGRVIQDLLFLNEDEQLTALCVPELLPQLEKLYNLVGNDIALYHKLGKALKSTGKESEDSKKHFDNLLNLHRVINDAINGERPKQQSFLKSLRQIGGFYFYLEMSGVNKNFHERADTIVKEYGQNSGKKAREHYNSFLHEYSRTIATKDNIKDLQAIVNEAMRQDINLLQAEKDLQKAKQDFEEMN